MIFSENQLAILITHHPEFHAWTKHINIAVHFLHDHVKKRILDLYYINTEYNLVDIFTKALKKPSHINFTHGLGLISGQGGVLDCDQNILKYSIYLVILLINMF